MQNDILLVAFSKKYEWNALVHLKNPVSLEHLQHDYSQVISDIPLACLELVRKVTNLVEEIPPTKIEN